MAIKISGALRDHILTTGSLAAALTGMVIRIYAGAVPQLPEDDVAGNPLLCTISDDGTGTGLGFEASAINGMLTKNGVQVWKGTCVDTGTATFYRMLAVSDTGGASLTAKRMQGTVNIAGADLNVTSAAFAANDEKRIDYFAVGMLVS